MFPNFCEIHPKVVTGGTLIYTFSCHVQANKLGTALTSRDHRIRRSPDPLIPGFPDIRESRDPGIRGSGYRGSKTKMLSNLPPDRTQKYSGIQESRNPRIQESRNRGNQESRNRGKLKTPGIQECRNPTIRESKNLGIQQSGNLGILCTKTKRVTSKFNSHSCLACFLRNRD